jgi:hypothetical protein
MSRTKHLKSLPENNINLFKVFSLLVPDKKSKYTETLLRIVKNSYGIDDDFEEIKIKLKDELDFDEKYFDELEKIEVLFFITIYHMFKIDNLKTFIDFCKMNERGLIEQNDLSRYTSFDQISTSLSLAVLKLEKKTMEKQVKILLDNDEWVVLRPLTFLSSKKYGSNTKWCTTSENNPEYFGKFSKKGVLIYCMNKLTGYKVASFYSLIKYEPEFSFWDQQDNRIDSLETELTSEIIKLIYDESKDKNVVSNYDLLDKSEKEKENKKYPSDVLNPPLPPPIDIERADYIRRTMERFRGTTTTTGDIDFDTQLLTSIDYDTSTSLDPTTINNEEENS